MIATYLVLVEFAKKRFYAAQAHPKRAAPTQTERHQRRVARRAAHFTRRSDVRTHARRNAKRKKAVRQSS
jgi:hypothetical protein